MTEAEQAAAQAKAAVENAQAGAQNEIEAAKQRADEAAAEARRIADAAMSSELGQRVNTVHTEFSTWKTEADRRLQEQAEAQRQFQAELGQATTLLGSIRELLTTPAPKAPTSEAAPAMAPTGVSSSGTEQKEKPAPVKAETPAPAPPRKRRFL